MRKSLFAAPVALLAFSFGASAQTDRLPVGTNVTVRTNSSIDLKNPPSDERIYTGVVDQDVRDPQGNVAIPRGANAELVVRNLGDRDVALDIDSITVNGRRYIVSTYDQPVAGDADRKSGVGKNERTAKYMGGGALLGTIIGAIAGGGKGAAIGAAAGAGAGAATQTMTRGSSVRVPAESLLTFRLDRPLAVGTGEYSNDRGYYRNGYHYHGDPNDNRWQQRQYRYR
jgi:hypothetical protein